MSDDLAKVLLAMYEKILFPIITVLPVMVIQGWVLAILWGWFIVPIFNVPSIGTAQAVGFLFVTRIVSPGPAKEKTENIAKTIMIAAVFPLFSLFFAYLVHAWISVSVRP